MIVTAALLRPILTLAVVYIVLGPLILGIEYCVIGSQRARAQALPLAIIATEFYAYSCISLVFHHRLLRQGSKFVTAFHLANHTFRLLLAILTLLVFALIIPREHLVPFTANIAAFYVITMMLTAHYSIKVENNKLKNTKNEGSTK